jgi:hypothetical protein
MWICKLIALTVLIGFTATASLTTPSKDMYLKNIDERCSFLERLAPPYVWGGYWGLLGNDCSGGMYDIVSQSKPVKRTTAFRMWLGYGNWGTHNIEGSRDGFENGKFPDLVFFNYGGKMASHVGMWREKTAEEMAQSAKLKKDTKMFAEASSSSRYFKRTMVVKGDGRYKAMLGTKKLDF